MILSCSIDHLILIFSMDIAARIEALSLLVFSFETATMMPMKYKRDGPTFEFSIRAIVFGPVPTSGRCRAERSYAEKISTPL